MRADPPPVDLHARRSHAGSWIALGVLSVASAVVIVSVRLMFERAFNPFQAGYLLWIVVGTFAAAYSLLHVLRAGVPLLQKVPRLAWVPLTIVLSLFGAGGAARCSANAVFDHELEVANRELEPLLQVLAEGKPDALTAIPTSSHGELRIWRSGTDFVVGVTAGSVNIDGSILLYDSGTKSWRRVWNGMLDVQAEERVQSLRQVYP